MDANEDTIKGLLNSLLTGPGLLMQEGVCSHHPPLPATPTFKAKGRIGQVPIDTAYMTPDLPLEAGTWLSARRGPRDHRFCILEIRWKPLVREDLFKVQCPEA